MVYCLPTSLNEGRGKHGGLSMEGEVEGGAPVMWCNGQASALAMSVPLLGPCGHL